MGAITKTLSTSVVPSTAPPSVLVSLHLLFLAIMWILISYGVPWAFFTLFPFCFSDYIILNEYLWVVQLVSPVWSTLLLRPSIELFNAVFVFFSSRIFCFFFMLSVSVLNISFVQVRALSFILLHIPCQNHHWNQQKGTCTIVRGGKPLTYRLLSLYPFSSKPWSNSCELNFKAILL